jgi:hypothetical protein
MLLLCSLAKASNWCNAYSHTHCFSGRHTADSRVKIHKLRRIALRQHSSGLVIGLFVALVLGFGVFAGIVLSMRAAGGLGYEPNVVQAKKTGPNTAELDLSTYPDSNVCHPNAPDPEIGWVSYCASNASGPSTTFELPPNSVITVVIKQYDSASGLYNDFFQTVQGTVGGTMIVNGKSMTQINADDAAHTFAIQSSPDETNPIYVSVPLLGTPDNAPNAVTVQGNPYPKPNVISFQFRTGPAGHTYIWHCYVPCGNDRETPYGFTGAMSTTGYMAGTIIVSSY